jgi:hypothetical protein
MHFQSVPPIGDFCKLFSGAVSDGFFDGRSCPEMRLRRTWDLPPSFQLVLKSKFFSSNLGDIAFPVYKVRLYLEMMSENSVLHDFTQVLVLEKYRLQNRFPIE